MTAGEANLAGLPSAAAAGHVSADDAASGRTALLAAHWRGQLPLARSLWLNAVLVGALAAMAAASLSMQFDVTAGSVRPIAGLALLAWPLALALQAWGIVGAWRSSGRGAESRPAWVTLASRALLAALATLALASAAWHDLPRSPAWVRLLFGNDPQGDAVTSLSADGQRLQLRGWLGPGTAARVQQAAAAAPALRVLEIDSPGGRFHEALQLAAALRDQGWTVRVKGACLDACTMVLMAGAVRQLLPDAQWGIVRPAAVSFNPLFTRLAKRRLAALYTSAGLPGKLVTTGLAMPHDFQWRAPWGDLAAAGVATTLPYPLDIPLQPAPDTPASELAEALRSNPGWHGLERRFPGTIASAAERLRSARASGAERDAAMLAALETTEPLLAKLLFNAGPELREQYAQLLLQALKATRQDGSDTCVRLLSGEAGARRALPPPLVAREAVWLADAAAEPRRETMPRVPSAIELEVVRRSLGPDAPALLMGLRHPGEAGVRHCDRIGVLLAQVQQLAPAERKLAVRLMFERP